MYTVNAKLTLQLDKAIIDYAKEFAAQNRTSLSKMIERYFRRIKKERTAQEEAISPLVKELSGSFRVKGEVDEKKLKKSYLSKKYL